jgi:hypothetical protein
MLLSLGGAGGSNGGPGGSCTYSGGTGDFHLPLLLAGLTIIVVIIIII